MGVVTYGQAAIGQTEPRTAHSFIPEFEAHLLGEGMNSRLSVEDFARKLGSFFREQWQAGMPDDPNIPEMTFLVAGFDEDAAYGRVFRVSIPHTPDPVEQNANSFGVTWGGQQEFVARLISGFDPRAAEVAKQTLGLDDDQVAQLSDAWRSSLSLPIPYQFLPLQDCVDLSMFLVRMTAAIQTWTVDIRGVGGAIDVATVTRTDGFRAIREKRIEATE